MLLFTADRPDELRGTGANQTIEQREIYGTYPRLFLNMPVSDDLPVEIRSSKLSSKIVKFVFPGIQARTRACELDVSGTVYDRREGIS